MEEGRPDSFAPHVSLNNERNFPVTYFPAVARKIVTGFSLRATVRDDGRIPPAPGGTNALPQENVWCEAEGRMIDLATDAHAPSRDPVFPRREMTWLASRSPAHGGCAVSPLDHGRS
jgi:hypothetical protein